MFGRILGRKNRLRELEIRVATMEHDFERIDNVINALVTILKKQNLIPKEYEDLDSEHTAIIEDETFNAERLVNEYFRQMYDEREKLEMKRKKRGDDRKYVA